MKLFSKTDKPRFIPYSKRLLSAMMVVTIIVAAVIGVALCQTAMELIHDMESTLVQKNVQIIGQNMSRTMESVDEFALEIVTSEPVQMFCKSQTTGASKEYNTSVLSVYLERQIQTSHNDYRFNANFLNVYTKNGMSETQFENLPYSDYDSCVRYYEDMEIISNERYTPMTWVDCVQLRDASGKSVNSLIWIRFLYDSVTMEKIGVVVGGINEAVFKDVFSVLPHAYLCQADGKVLSATDSEMYGEYVSENIRSQVLKSSVAVNSIKSDKMEDSVSFWKDTFFSMMLIVPETTLQAEMQNMTQWYILCSIVIIGIGVILGALVNYFLTKSLSKSILSLKDTVQRVDQGELNARFDNATHNDEITYLGEHFNHMLDSLERIYAEQEQEALGRKDLEIQLLQSQINPHLLYNTLNSVALAVRNDEQQTAQNLLYTLSDFIRLSLSNGHSVVPLATELELLKKYILLQKMASHRDIQLDIQVPEELLSAMVIRTSLQPIVENAVLHGFAGYRDDGCIQIRAVLAEDCSAMDLYIRDNGLGIEDAVLLELNRTINTKDYQEMCSHFGLYNVNWRIKYTWGSEDYGITIESEESDYTEVKIHLPYVSGEGK